MQQKILITTFAILLAIGTGYAQRGGGGFHGGGGGGGFRGGGGGFSGGGFRGGSSFSGGARSFSSGARSFSGATSRSYPSSGRVVGSRVGSAYVGRGVTTARVGNAYNGYRTPATGYRGRGAYGGRGYYGGHGGYYGGYGGYRGYYGGWGNWGWGLGLGFGIGWGWGWPYYGYYGYPYGYGYYGSPYYGYDDDPVDPYGDGTGTGNDDSQMPPPNQPGQYNQRNNYDDNNYSYPNPDSLQNRPGTNNASPSTSSYNNGNNENGDKVWVKPHWKHTNDGWIWIDGYWKTRTTNYN